MLAMKNTFIVGGTAPDEKKETNQRWACALASKYKAESIDVILTDLLIMKA